jgi:hypothetical protein
LHIANEDLRLYRSWPVGVEPRGSPMVTNIPRILHENIREWRSSMVFIRNEYSISIAIVRGCS